MLLCAIPMSSHRIGLESLRSGAQEFRHRREVPITLLGMDVPEVDGEVGEQCLHVQPLLVPALHPGHGEGMAKRHQAGLATTARRHNAYTLAEPREPVLQGTILQRLPPLGYEKGVGQPIVVQAGALHIVVMEMFCSTGMKRHNPGFVELCLTDM